jgi:hypothetical protein
MIKPQKRSLKQKLIGGLAGLILSATGCVTGGSVGAFVGSHNPSSQQTGSYVNFDNSTETGIRARAKTKSKIEVEVAYSGHETSYEDVIETDDIKASDLSVSASYPVWNNRTVFVNVGGGIVSRSEAKTLKLIGIPGSDTDNRTATGWKAGVEARWQPHKNVSVEAGLDFHGFDNSYEKCGTTLSLGASYTF